MACRFWVSECFSPHRSRKGLYTGPKLGAKEKNADQGKRVDMGKAVKIIIALAVVGAALYLLQMRVTDRPMVKVETPVSQDALR